MKHLHKTSFSQELPPLEELTITVDENVEMVEVGTVASVVGVLG